MRHNDPSLISDVRSWMPCEVPLPQLLLFLLIKPHLQHLLNSSMPGRVAIPLLLVLLFFLHLFFILVLVHHCLPLPSHYPLLLISSTSWTVRWGCPFYLALACCQPSMSRGAGGAKQTKLFTFYFQQDCRQNPLLLPLKSTNRGNKKGCSHLLLLLKMMIMIIPVFFFI